MWKADRPRTKTIKMKKLILEFRMLNPGQEGESESGASEVENQDEPVEDGDEEAEDEDGEESEEESEEDEAE